jgi:hypothetical protein
MGSEVAELKKLVESLSKEVTRLAGKFLWLFKRISTVLIFYFQTKGRLRNCISSMDTI